MLEIAAGSRLGSHEILSPLGAGGMGQVYLARDEKLGRRVAIKLLLGDRRYLRDAAHRFTQEARSASALNHPNIVTIYDVGVDGDGNPYIVMEYIDGRTLRDVISEGRLGTRKLLQIAAQVADGLAAAHQLGIVHRDLKPENIMVGRDGLVKIVDFGLAKTQTSWSDENEATFELDRPPTRPGTVLGTVGYMSPEQANGVPVDFRSDQFSFGAIVYEMATGVRAFRRATPLDTLAAIVHDEPESMSRVNPRVPAQLRWIVERCLSKQREDRYASTLDLARELRILSERLGETSTSSNELELQPRRNLWQVAFSCAASVMVLAASVMLFRHRDGESTKPELPTVTVVPFRSYSGTETPLGRGLAETIRIRLGSNPRLQVIAPVNDISAASILSLSSRSGADITVRGGLQEIGDQLRVSWAIVRRNGEQVSAGSFNASRRDVITIEDRVAADVANALAPGSEKLQADEKVVDEDRYLQAVGQLQRYADPAAVNEAIRILQELTTRERSPRVVATLGRAYMRRFLLSHDAADATRAQELASSAAARSSRDADVQFAAGDVALNLGRYTDAITFFRRAQAIRPHHADAVLYEAEALELAGKLPEAEKTYERAIAMRPQYWGGFNKLGVMYLLNARASEAVTQFEKATQLAPDNTRVLDNLGAAYEQQGEFAKAVATFERSLQITPTANTHSNIGTCRYYLGDYGGAADAFRRAAGLDPKNYVLWANLGDALRLKERADAETYTAYTRAIDLAREQLALNANDVEAASVLAICLARQGDFEGAEQEIATATRVAPNQPRLLYRAALIAAVRRDAPEAKRRLERAIAAGYDRSEAQREPDFAALSLPI